MSQSQRRVATYRSLAVNDLADAIGWNSYLPRKLRGGDAYGGKFFGENFTWMDWLWWHEQSPFSRYKWSMPNNDA